MERYNESSDVRQLFRGAVAVRGTAGEVDYYWLDDTVDRITFSKENTLTVHWRCGLKTTVPLPVRHRRENPVYAAEVYRKRKVEGTLKPRRRIQKRLEDPNPIPIIPVKGERKQ